MSYVESQLLHRKVPENEEVCVSCGVRFFWWEGVQGRCEMCGPEPEPKEPK